MLKNKLGEAFTAVHDVTLRLGDLAMYGVDQAYRYVDHHPLYKQTERIGSFILEKFDQGDTHD